MAWTPPHGITLDDAYDEIVRNKTINNWNRFARSALRLDQYEINEIEPINEDQPINSLERKHEMFLKWQEKAGRAASVERIYTVLNHFLFPEKCPKPDSDAYPWTPPPAITLNDAYDEIVRKITNSSWKRFARSALRLDQYEIDDIEQDYQKNSQERKHEMFLKWQETAGRAASVERIYAVLNHFLFPKKCPKPDSDAYPWTPPPAITLNDAYDEILQKITTISSWNRFARVALRLDQREIDDIEQAHPRSSQERKHKLFLKWQEKPGWAASVETIYAVLNHFLFPKECPKPRTRPEPGQSQQKPPKYTLKVPSNEDQMNINYCEKVQRIAVLPTEPGFYQDTQDANYPRKNKKGRTLILNNMFPHLEGQPGHRLASKIDQGNLKQLWTQLGSEVQVEEDLHADQIKLVMNEFADKCAGYDYCVVFIISHGDRVTERDVVLGNDHKPVFVKEDILDKFNNENAKHLHHIPKIFFFQCDRGSVPDGGVACFNSLTSLQNLESNASTNKADSTKTSHIHSDSGPLAPKVPTTSDMLVSYATQSGNQAFIHTEDGSWYVNAITNVFMKHARDEHVADMMTEVHNAVSSQTTPGEQGGSMAMPEFTSSSSTSIKKLYLYPGLE